MKLSFRITVVSGGCLAVVVLLLVFCFRSYLSEPKTDWTNFLNPLPSTSARGLTISAAVVETGTSDGMPAYIVATSVYNTSAKPIVCAIYSCAWIQSWEIMPADYVGPPLLVCPGNSLNSEIIQPGGKIVFRIPLVVHKKWASPDGVKIRLSFRLCDPLVFESLYGKKDLKSITVVGPEILLPKITGNRELKMWSSR